MSAVLAIAGSIYLFLITVWSSGALFYDVGQRSRWGWFLIAGWLAFVCVTVILLQPFLYAVLMITAVVAVLVGWWLTQRPSNDRNWAPIFPSLVVFRSKATRSWSAMFAISNIVRLPITTFATKQESIDCRKFTRPIC